MKPLPVLVAVVVLGASIGVISWMSQPRVTVQPVPGVEPVPTENPLLSSPSGPHPAAILEEDVHDFGKMVMGETGSHAFVIRNEGEVPLKLKLKKSTCKCTVPTFPEGAIPAGESAEITLDWELQQITESFSQHAVIWTNDPDHDELILQILGQVAPAMQTIPGFPWTIGNIKEDEETTFSCFIGSGSESFNVLSIEPSEDWLTVEIEPADPEELKSHMSSLSSGYLLKGKVRPEMSIGRFEAQVTIRTDLGEDNVVTGSVIGARSGPFSLIGQNWLGSEMAVMMGDVDHAEGKSVTLSLFTERHEEPIALESFVADPDLVTVSFSHDESFQTPIREKYDLTFTIPPQQRLGRFIGEDRIDVTLSTNRAELKEIHLSVDANIK